MNTINKSDLLTNLFVWAKLYFIALIAFWVIHYPLTWLTMSALSHWFDVSMSAFPTVIETLRTIAHLPLMVLFKVPEALVNIVSGGSLSFWAHLVLTPLLWVLIGITVYQVVMLAVKIVRGIFSLFQ